jgi:branched-chain amino acid transport system ATP-binding protein
MAQEGAAMTEFALEGIGLTRRFGGFVALDGVDIAVKRGEIRGLIGPNGAGKSTLIDVLSGRAKSRGGRVLLNGEDISDLSSQQRHKRGMARSFQRTNIFPELTVEQQLRVASWAVADANTAEVMDELNLVALAALPAAEISYGEQRRLDLALALVGRPSVLLLDEPAAGLTTEESFSLARILRDLANRWNVTVLLVEHDMQVVFSICDRISVLHLGRSLSEGSCAEIRINPTVIAASIGTEAA